MSVTKKDSRFLSIFLSMMAMVCFAARLLAEDGPEAPKPYGIDQRDLWTTSRVVGRPEPPPPYRLQRVFPKLKFSQPVYLIAEPDPRSHGIRRTRNTIYGPIKVTNLMILGGTSYA